MLVRWVGFSVKRVIGGGKNGGKRGPSAAVGMTRGGGAMTEGDLDDSHPLPTAHRTLHTAHRTLLAVHCPLFATHWSHFASATKIISGEVSPIGERSKSPYTALTRNPHRSSRCSTSYRKKYRSVHAKTSRSSFPFAPVT